MNPTLILFVPLSRYVSQTPQVNCSPDIRWPCAESSNEHVSSGAGEVSWQHIKYML